MLPFPVGMMKTGGGAFEMTDLGSDLKAWFDAQGGTYMTLSTADVTQWTDRSGNGRHLTPGGAVPTYGSNMVTCTRNSGQNFQTWAVALPANVWDCYIVGNPDDTAGYRAALSDSGGNNFFMILDGSHNLEIYNSGDKTSGLTWTGSGLRQAMVRLTNSTTASMNLNGATSLSTVTPGTLGNLTTAPYIGGTFAQEFGGFHEIVFTTTGLSDANRQKVEGRLAWKWDGILGGSTLVTALPALHPYKSSPP